MEWTNNASADLLRKLFQGIGKLDSEQLLTAINDAYMQVGVEPISAEIARIISRTSRVNLVWDLLIETDCCDQDRLTYWIDPQGKHKIIIT